MILIKSWQDQNMYNIISFSCLQILISSNINNIKLSAEGLKLKMITVGDISNVSNDSITSVRLGKCIRLSF